MPDIPQNLTKEDILLYMSKENAHVEELEKVVPENYFNDLKAKLLANPKHHVDIEEVKSLGLYEQLIAFIINNDGAARLRRIHEREEQENEGWGGDSLGRMGF